MGITWTNPVVGGDRFTWGTKQNTVNDLFGNTINQMAPSLFAPSGWGTFWKAARANAGTTPARIAVLGDSLGMGHFASNLDTTSWPSLIRASLQTTYGDGGSGYKAPTYSSPWMTAEANYPGAITVWAAAGNLMTVNAGTWTVANASAGPASDWGALQTTTASGAMTATGVRGTSVTIYTISAAGANADWSYQIDGGGAVTVTDATGPTGIRTTVITGLANTSHTVKVIRTASGAKTFYFAGVRGTNATGVLLDNYSIFGEQALQWDGYDTNNSPSWAGGANQPADLIIYELGANDALATTTLALYLTYVQKYLEDVRDNATTLGAIDVLFVLPPVTMTGGDTAALWGQYVGAVFSLAQGIGAAVVSIYGRWRQSWNYANSQNWWGNPSNPAIAGTDTLHPCDAGHQDIANAILPFLTA